MNKKYSLSLNGLIIFVGLLMIIITFWFLIFTINVVNKKEKAEYNKCVRILINEDEIENGCDKYFLNDKWYNDFMKQMFDEYKKIK